MNLKILSLAYLKATRPLALSRKRDAYLLMGAAGVAVLLLIIIVVIIILAAKRKRAQSAVAAPPTQSILKKDREYTPTTLGRDNTAYTSETEVRVSIEQSNKSLASFEHHFVDQSEPICKN